MEEKSSKIPRTMEIPFTEKGKTKILKVKGGEEELKFCFFNVAIKLPIRYPSADVKWPTGYRFLGFQRESSRREILIWKPLTYT